MADKGEARADRKPPDGESPRAGTIFQYNPLPPTGSVRAFPRLLWTALSIVWKAGPRELGTTLALQLVAGAATAAAVLAGENVLSGIITARAEDGSFRDFVPSVIVLVAATTAIGLARAVEVSKRELLAERTTRYTQARILDVTCAIELDAFEQPEFHDRLARAQANARMSTMRIVQGVTMVLRAVASSLGVMLALVAIQPVLLPLAFLALVPAWLDTRARAKSFFFFAFRMLPGTASAPTCRTC